MAQVALCVPHGEKLSPMVNRALLSMQNNYRQHEFLYVEVDTIIIGKARNMMVDTSLAQNVDVLFSIDDDVLVPENAGDLIEQSLALDIVSGIYYNRRMPYTPQIFKLAEEPAYKADGLYWPMLEFPSETDVFEVDAVGAGCMCVRASVYKKLREYWGDIFKTASEQITHPAAAKLVADFSPWYEFLNKRGEDMYFCERAKEAGYSIWVNPTIQCQHLGQMAVAKEHFDYLKNNNLIIKEPIK